ncbi:GYDIA family GHMP kinase [Winogradskyella aquimaris]|uniref:GYDIA family GHMP kinase n=1 Tax=Winogradskyella aquimaris TaxID=864074 RepID=A0ABU5EP16_9FLAO|nr:GYDIA family GHMP kinase [Winogradskyella aquimaris]MDY2587298.1 GYDIA family GHMP kinase [Winogradskyella aquimaris]
METFCSNGKLLITGEYVVLDGAKALAIPTKYGQRLTVERTKRTILDWKSYDENGNLWFAEAFAFDDSNILNQNKNENAIAIRLMQILEAAKALNPDFLKTGSGYNVSTHLDFKRTWGLGTSSTLINNVAQWANIDAYRLLEKTFGGSGYDIACAQHKTSITFQLSNAKHPIVNPVAFDPSFKNQLYFVYLNKKQNSREGIETYKTLNRVNDSILEDITAITEKLITTKTLYDFEVLLDQHEHLVAEIIHQEPIKSKLFKDFEGSVKSLGAWGGDFVLVTSKSNPSTYFKSKGFETVIPYSEMVLN